MGIRRAALLATVALCAAVSAAPAQATFPGENGKIAFMRGGNIWTMNPDGTGRAQITTGGSTSSPRWSPDGTQIVFNAPRANADPALPYNESDIWVMDADGSSRHQVTDTPGHGFKYGGSWSPDGTRIAYGDGRHIWTIKPDGTDAQRITQDPTNPDCFSTYGAPIWSPDGMSFTSNGYSYCFEHEYSVSMIVDLAGNRTHSWFTSGFEYLVDWSPDSHQVLFGTDGPDSGQGMYRVNLDGGGAQLTDGTYYDSGAWSPDGERIVLSRSDGSDARLYIIDADDGSNMVPLSEGDASEGGANWQPIPINGYPRPKGTYPLELSLVPAYQPCTAPNRTHGPPLAFPSCAPPQRSPGQLTVGTADSNQRPTKSVSIIRLRALPGIPSTPADEADIALSGTVNDVRLASDLSDYTGTLEARMSLRITDKDNTPHPGGPGAATVQDITYSFPIPCSATADTTIGGDCTFDTTAEAFVPGIAKELRRSIWELGALRVHDGAGNLFLTQGIFVP
jgi:hypothetical protein